ncbi:DedA family protein [Leptolyngbya sp. AN02str]|uniref:DedA family protein n=1 Tax=Leptolyngbya sp. AN02str TaxID=3423363 RepID=UPI003D323EBA
MAEWIVQTMQALGYWGIGLLMFLENLFPPIPSELIMPLAGFTIAQGEMSFVSAIAAGVIGTILGTLLWYAAGRIYGERRLIELADRYGKWITVSGRDVETAIAWFNKYGAVAVLLCRLVPGVRTLISLPAGLAHMNLGLFLAYSTIGTVLWTTLLTVVGYVLGDNYEQVEQYLGPVSKIIAVAIVVGFGLWIWKRSRDRKSSS